MKRTFGLFCSAFLLCTALHAAENWPQFRGPGGQGHADEARLPIAWDQTNNVTWRTELPGQGWSSPVIWGERIWMTCATGGGLSFRALCVDKAGGELLHDIEIFTRATPMTIHNKNSHASPTPVIEEGRVYVNFGTTGTACLDSESGKIIWSSTELQLDHMTGPGSSPILYKNLLILTCDGTNVQYVAALDKQTGKIAWKTPRSGELKMAPDARKSFCTPLTVEVDGQDQLIIPGAFWAYAYEPLTGKEIWKVHTPGFSTTPRPVAGNDLIYIGTGFMNPEFWAVRLGGHGDVTETHIAWKCNKKMPLKPSPLLVGNEIYVVSDTSTASCLDAKTGALIWEQRLTGNFSASPIIADGRIYFCSEEGRTTVIAPGREFKQIAVNSLGERIMASPAVTHDTLFIRTDKALYRIEESRR
jgi:outer membrane protein assembly factor BamB